MPNTIPLTGLYSIVVLPENTVHVAITRKNVLIHSERDEEAPIHEIPLNGHYTAIGFPADVSEEECRAIMDAYKEEFDIHNLSHDLVLMLLESLIKSKSLDPATSFIIKAATA